ncbi:hypothetical protein MLD38_039709 [Melastoma candidum]|uniref:Uncharacterized protein n=1 Tax=Melastoma candidum TaxID=119954 RepID=A0ACB9L3N9_9MYRT|nr:hypothetical protein MLD38_039709 [Melastoma candidum]
MTILNVGPLSFVFPPTQTVTSPSLTLSTPPLQFTAEFDSKFSPFYHEVPGKLLDSLAELKLTSTRVPLPYLVRDHTKDQEGF